MLKMSDIASHAGVSPTTVSFVLNGRHDTLRISEKTRNKVLEAAEELGYRSNQLARAMRTGNTKMLGILGGYPAEEQVGKMLAGALEAADDQGYTLKMLRLHALGSNARQVIRRISELRLMGMLALHLPDAVLDELFKEASEYDTPVVLLDGRCENPDIAQVVSDDEGGITAGVEFLASLGHKRIAFIGGGVSVLGKTRRAAFEAALTTRGLPVIPEYVVEGSFNERALSAQAAHKVLSLPAGQRPTAIFGSGDVIALAALQVAAGLGIRVPQELSVIGFANILASEYATPALTTIEQPFLEMGRTAVNLLLNSIEGRSAVQQPAYEVHAGSKIQVLPTRLVERATAAPLQTANKI
jgi:DNA-binding LacI/PurR family transcriptional regulator